MAAPEPASAPKDDISTYITARLFPHYDVNSKGYRIGSYEFLLNKKKIPFNTVDEVDNFLNNFFQYVDKASNNKDSIKNFNENFLKDKVYEKKFLILTPIKYRKKTVAEATKELNDLNEKLKTENNIDENKKLQKDIDRLKKLLGTHGGKKKHHKKTMVKKSIKNRTRKNHSS